ncbi:MAG: PepSY protein [Hydrocarboniphaga sp.]|uniref:PepSY-associated TM helix domain-containing protein n=1 Tax=Hydrocarboniphaga sp. TaxID=2033016 RepID=UPI0026357713|nr:PepSY domain-containing protein [Hydrocarboniphaga sp.]MDB5972416.1 PepSY protein [Hydrocarboniphaga sp.]
MSAADSASARGWPAYRAIWRWHFYAGLFCIPFVLWLATSGAIYLFKPQIEAWIDRPFDSLAIIGAPASARAQVDAATAALPGSRLLAYELPPGPQSAVRVLLKYAGEDYRVYVHPRSLQILKLVREDSRPMRVISQLHGNLLIGDRGSFLVELAASWAIVMIVSGLFLWWPRGASGLGGVLYPRLGGGRRFWRDLHGVVGFWVSAFALFLLLSGLPWTKFWGGNLKAARQFGNDVVLRQDWPGGGNAAAAGEHDHGPHPDAAPEGSGGDALDRVIASVAALHLAPPVLIAPPSRGALSWTARSDAQNRPLRVTLSIDGASGAILQRQDFSQRALLDRIIGTGVAAHEGQLFGWLNQLLGLLTALGLITLCVSALAMWWKRRPAAVLGAPPPAAAAHLAWSFTAVLCALGLLLPMLGLSLIAVLAIERLLLRRLPRARRFLGLQGPA